MNFQDLLAKMKQIDESVAECGDMPSSADGELLTSECGAMGPSEAPKQSDSVTMSVNMNGSGSGGIKDLLDILRNIENAGGQDADDVLVGMETDENVMSEPQDVPVPQSGEDLHRSKDEYEKVNGGGNPMNVDESLISKLTSLYQEVKAR